MNRQNSLVKEGGKIPPPPSTVPLPSAKPKGRRVLKTAIPQKKPQMRAFAATTISKSGPNRPLVGTPQQRTSLKMNGFSWILLFAITILAIVLISTVLQAMG